MNRQIGTGRYTSRSAVGSLTPKARRAPPLPSSEQHQPGWWSCYRKPKDMTVLMSVFVVSCSMLLLLAATLSCLSIWPRLGRSDAPENPLYYRHLSERYGTFLKAQQAVNAALSDDEAYVKHLSAQIVANATVATRKYRWVGGSIVALVVALGCLLGAVLTQWFGW
ncbi:MAG: hypothetical protein IPO80_07510 [Propionibacteriaceae bacterium]|nr:hypothetical protein [Propionibacteriaceae bacterium]